ncbi:MAG: TraB/GumN family protein [Duncaniella sp.]|nr:TraB/GumN family protein [Duncaniella sp.]
MKKLLFTIISVLLLGYSSAEAQLLWKISGNGLEKPSYIFGTHHMAPASVLDSVPGFKEALASVDKVYGEMVMADAMSPESQQMMMMAAIAPQDSTLTAVLSPAAIDSLNNILAKYLGPQMTAAALNPMKPAMVSTLLAAAQTQSAFPQYNAAQQLDGEIQSRATAIGKEVGGLETMADQCQALFGGSILAQANDLMQAVRNDEIAIDVVKQLANAYLAGDLQAMLDIMENPATGFNDEQADRMLNRRNADWMRVLAGMLPTMSILIAVGAGHLPGDKGLISLLRREGYTVEPTTK